MVTCASLQLLKLVQASPVNLWHDQQCIRPVTCQELCTYQDYCRREKQRRPAKSYQHAIYIHVRHTRSDDAAAQSPGRVQLPVERMNHIGAVLLHLWSS